METSNYNILKSGNNIPPPKINENYFTKDTLTKGAVLFMLSATGFSQVVEPSYIPIKTQDYRIIKRTLSNDSNCYSYQREYILKMIKEFQNFPDNWDGYGAIPVLKESADNSHILINELSNSNIEKNTDIYPNPSGTVSLKFERGERVVSLEIGDKTFTYYAELPPLEVQYRDYQPFENDKIKELIKFISEV